MISIRYSKDADSLPMRVRRRMIALLIGGVGKCSGRPKCLRTSMGPRLNPIWLKLRILMLIMNRKNLLELNIQTSSCVQEWKPMLRGDKIMFTCVLCPYECHTILKKQKRNVFKNLTQILTWSYRGDVAKWIWGWYCSGYELVSNVVTAFECHTWKGYRVFVWWVVTYVIVVCNWKLWNLGEGRDVDRV